MVDHERDSEHGDARRDGGLDRDRERPGRLAGCLDEGAGCRRASEGHVVARRKECSRAAVEDGLGRRDDDDEVGAGDCLADTNVRPDRHEIGIGRVMDDDASSERTCLGRRQESLELLPPDSSLQSTRDEQRHVLFEDTEIPELVEHRRERKRSRIDVRTRQWERGRLHDDRYPRAPLRELRKRPARERERHGVAHCRPDVDKLRRRGWRAQDDVVDSHRDGDDPRAREKRHATHELQSNQSRRTDLGIRSPPTRGACLAGDRRGGVVDTVAE